METIFNNVNHLIECQRFAEERVIFLEQKRLEISCWITNLGHSEYKFTLENKINQLEIKITKVIDIKIKTNRENTV